MSIFQEVKERISLKEIVRAYGIELNRSDMCICPFHAEKTASMKVYDKGFRCYGCGEGGDTLRFVQKFFNLSNTLEAAHKINEDFNLGIQTDRRPTRAEVTSAQLAVQQRIEFEQRDKQAFFIFSEYFSTLRDYSRLAPKTEYEIPDKRFIEYLQNFERIDYVLEMQRELSHNPLQERIQFLDDHSDYIAFVAERLLEIRNEKAQTNVQTNVPVQNTENTQRVSATPVQKQSVSQNTAPAEVPKKVDYKIIGNTPYKNIQDKAYLKYSNSFADKVVSELQSRGIRFSGKVTERMTTFTINSRDVGLVRSIASAEAEKFTGRNKPQIIPTQNRQKTANMNRQSDAVSL